MAMERFDDVAEKARALEAQAKKLRREAHAARTKAYADALVAVFPEVKDMGSAEEVLDFVKGLKPGAGHGTPDARAAGAADDFRVANDPVRQFLDDILIRATWDVLPWQFVFDLYRHWFMRNNPSGRFQSRKSLINDVKGIISDYEGWDYSDNPVSIPDEMYDTPEGLIGMYGVFEWEEPGYRGSNPNRSYLYHGSKRTRGLVRVANDPLRQFADEIFPAASWHLLPCKFLYDLYRHWFQRNQPSGRMLGRNAFYESIEGLAEEQGWQLQERVRVDGRMDFPEPLILEYDVTEWMNKTYRGSDTDRRCMPELKDSYRGYVRISTAFFDGGYDIDDSTIKEE